MKICPHCGVFVEDESSRCPLCLTPLVDGGEAREDGKGDAVTGGGPTVPHGGPRFWLLEILSLLAAVSAIVVFAADFAFGFTLTWSPIPLSAIIYAWAVAVAVVVLGRREVLLSVTLTGATLLFLLVLDVLTEGKAWFLMPALPLTLLTAVVTGLLVWIARRRGVSRLPAVAMVLVGGGIGSLGVELILELHRGGPLRVSWSIVVLACALAIALVVILVHRRLRLRHTSLERIFHM
ncbi:MAG: hypothetical protein GVY23_02090 [Spirochaetes bacterium]|jgi:hypothetical protein|nr:hypothetical protein [Spirochaetota bacterium]